MVERKHPDWIKVRAPVSPEYFRTKAILGGLQLDSDEPRRIAQAVVRLGLQHVVVTSVDRDDLQDGGAAHFAATAHAIKSMPTPARIEVLVPDFQGSFASVDTVVRSPIDIYN